MIMILKKMTDEEILKYAGWFEDQSIDIIQKNPERYYCVPLGNTGIPFYDFEMELRDCVGKTEEQLVSRLRQLTRYNRLRGKLGLEYSQPHKHRISALVEVLKLKESTDNDIIFYDLIEGKTTINEILLKK